MSRATVLAAALAAIALTPGLAWAAKANKPPSVTLTTPTAGQVFTTPATITLSATAADANGVAKVDFYRGSTLIGTDTTAPYSVDWANVPVGNYSLTATATDTLGATGTSPAVAVAVKAPVSALITSPANGAALYGSSVTIVGSFNGDKATTAVIVENGNTSRMAVPTSNNFSVSLPLLRGPNTITVVAARNDRTFDTYSVSVTGNDSPYVALRSPAAGTYDAPASLELEAEALSPGGSISRVEFLIDGVLRASDATAPYQYTWPSPPVG
ncbi:MAG: Ig-like domain-containing protein, partial [Arenimonas sp.]